MLLATPGVILALYGYASIPAAFSDFRHAYLPGGAAWADMIQSGLLPTWARGGIALLGVLLLIAYAVRTLQRRESVRALEAA